MAVGVLGSAVAHHLRVPGIVLFLALGVALGPDFADIIRPAVTGEALTAFVGFAVAIILFEGGLHMNLRKLRKQAKPIRRLVTIGALVTGIAAAIAVKLVMGWEWRLAILFGTLVTVTGPTVITPLLRRLRIKPNVSTILEAEGIFIDAVGATIAVVALNIVVSESALDTFGFIKKIGVGLGIGLAGGALLAVLLSRRRLIPEGLENVVGLSFAVVIYQISHSVEHESGITAAIVAGMVVSNTRSHAFEDLVEFKEQLVTLLIATLFVLLSADVRVQDVLDLGVPGLITVGILMFVIRPITVAVSTWGTDLTLREKAFLSWLAPRGIVAAAVASLFAAELEAVNIPGGTKMKALVFLVIAVTVTVQGFSGGFVARLLGLKRPNNVGYAILGANPLARAFARTLRAGGDPIVLIDASPEACEAARSEGFEVVLGNGLEERTMDLAMLDARIAIIALTANENVNFLFAKKVKRLYKGSIVYSALETGASGVTSDMVLKEDTRLLFGAERHLALWAGTINSDRVKMETWELEVAGEEPVDFSAAPIKALLPMAVRSGGKVTAVWEKKELKVKERLRAAVFVAYREEAYEWMRSQGFVPVSGKVVDASTELDLNEDKAAAT